MPFTPEDTPPGAPVGPPSAAEPVTMARPPIPVSIVGTVVTPERQAQIALTSGGQRRINLIWELTQSFIAIAVTTNTLSVCAWLVYKNIESATALSLLSNAFFLVIGFYFGRSNHTREGGTSSAAEGR